MRKIEVCMEVMTFCPTTEKTIPIVTTCTKIVPFQVALRLEVKDIFYPIWKLVCSMVAIPKINSKITFCVLGDGQVIMTVLHS